MKGLEVSLGRFFQDQLVQRQLGHSPLQLSVLSLELLKLARLVDAEPAVLGSPAVVEPALSAAEWVFSVTPISLTACATFLPLATATSTCRSLFRICSGE